ncbi:MAG: cytochrome-c peroxidase [Salibacteraceae bacterium]
MKKLSIILGAAVLLTGCTKEELPETEVEFSPGDVPVGFPEIDYPTDNAYTEARWELGKRLFYDPILSSDGKISCNSCHQQNLAFADDVAFSSGSDGAEGTRNSPSLANVAYHPYYTREGGVPTLEMQILVPIQEHNEFNSNIVAISEELSKDPSYVSMSQAAYERDPDPYVITRALANFERSLLSGNSPYDQYVYQGDSRALSKSAKRGLQLFAGKAKCGSCHDGFNFTNYAFENNGLYKTYDDVGRYRLTRDSADLAKFKVPSLRNVALTAPYMHDGSLPTLSSVVNHYDRGGEEHINKSSRIEPLNLTQEEKADLIAFLNSLTDMSFTQNSKFQNLENN